MPLTPEAARIRLLARARFVLANPKALAAVRSGVKGESDVQAILNDISDDTVREQMRIALTTPGDTAAITTDG